MEFDDPFAVTATEPTSGRRESVVNPVRPRALLPISLVLVAFVGMTLPWVVFRPLGKERLNYNVTDVPGGLGIAWTLGLVALPGLVLLLVGKRSGLVTLAVAVGVLGWMATISALLLGVITSLLPSLDIVGIDLTKTQVGQGVGVPITVVSSLVLGVMAIQSLVRDEARQERVRIPVLPILLLIPLILIGVNHHLGWLSLGSDDVGYRAELPGDSLYGSGLLLVSIWLGVGAWVISVVLQRRAVMLFSSILTLVVGAVSALYSSLIWIGGKAVTWLLPDSVDQWTSVEIQTPLIVTFVCGVLCVLASIAGVFPAISNRYFETSTDASLGQTRVSWNTISGSLLILGCIALTIVRIVT